MAPLDAANMQTSPQKKPPDILPCLLQANSDSHFFRRWLVKFHMIYKYPNQTKKEDILTSNSSILWLANNTKKKFVYHTQKNDTKLCIEITLHSQKYPAIFIHKQDLFFAFLLLLLNLFYYLHIILSFNHSILPQK